MEKRAERGYGCGVERGADDGEEFERRGC